MSGNGEVRIRVSRSYKKHSGFVAEERDDGCYYLTSVPFKCKDASIDDQIREINGIRWTDFEDEDHVNELLDDPKLKFIYMSIVPMDRDEDSDEEFSDDEGSEESGDVSIETDADDGEYSRVDSVINHAPSVAGDRPTGRRKIMDECSTEDDLDSLEEEVDEDASEESPVVDEEKGEEGEESDETSYASEGDGDHAHNAENDAYEQRAGRYDDEESDDDEEGSDEEYEETASEKREREAFEAAQRAKQAERDRAREIKKRKEEQRKEEERERNRRNELAKLRKDAEKQGQKLTKSKVKVERNIGAYSLGGAAKSSSGSKPSSGGWNKVTPNPKPKPSSSGWSKVSVNHKS